MMLKDLLQLATTLFPEKIATLGEIEKNVAAILTKEKDEDLAYANAILAQKIHSNDANKPDIENIVNILTHCAKAKINPPTSLKPLAEIKSLNQAGLFESKQETYATLNQEAFNYIKDKKQSPVAQATKTNPAPKPVVDAPKANKPSAPAGNFFADLKSVLNRKAQSTTTTPIAPTPKLTIPSLENKNSAKIPTPKPTAPLPIKPPVPQTKSDADEKLKNLEAQLVAKQKKLMEQHEVLLLLQNNLKAEEKKRREAEAKLEAPQKYSLTETEFNNLLKPYIECISEDRLFDLLFSITAKNLMNENKPFILRYVTRLYEYYKNINQKILFDFDAEPSNEPFSAEFNEELFKDLSSRYQDALHPKQKNPDFTEEQRKAHQICLSFFILVMSRMDTMKDQSFLQLLSNNPFTEIAKRHKAEIIKQVEKNCAEIINKTNENNLIISKLSEQKPQPNCTLFSASRESGSSSTANASTTATSAGSAPASTSITTMLMKSVGLA